MVIYQEMHIKLPSKNAVTDATAVLPTVEISVHRKFLLKARLVAKMCNTGFKKPPLPQTKGVKLILEFMAI